MLWDKVDVSLEYMRLRKHGAIALAQKIMGKTFEKHSLTSAKRCSFSVGLYEPCHHLLNFLHIPPTFLDILEVC